jgi:hypothetical protein
MGTVASLSKLLPTGTTLAFETMAPPFTRGGQCNDHDVNFIFTWGLISFLTLLCAALSFTDSVTDKYGNIYYGVATRDGLLLFNHDPKDLRLSDSDDDKENGRLWKHLKKTKKVKPLDFLHAFFSAAVFMALAFCNAGVQKCLVPWESGQWKELLSILPLAVGFLASFVFIIFPSNRLGIGKEGASDGDDAAPAQAPAPAPGGRSLQNIKTTEQQATNCKSSLQAMGITQVDPSTSYELGTVG